MRVKVVRFSIGFGKPIFLWHGKKGTEYAIGWLPLGGYVRLLNSRETEVSPEAYGEAFDHKPLWRRAVIVLAGPFTNLLFAVFAFWLVFSLGIQTIRPVIGAVTPASIASQATLVPGLEVVQMGGVKVHDWGDIALQLILRLGDKTKLSLVAHPFPEGAAKSYQLNLDHWKINPLKPELIKSLGIMPFRPDQPPVIQHIESGQPAAKAGLKPGDIILVLDGEDVKDWPDLVHKIWESPGKETHIKFRRPEATPSVLDVPIFIESRFSFKHFKRLGYVGIQPEKPVWPVGMKYERQYPVHQALSFAFKETLLLLKVNAVTLGKLVTGKISLKNLGGPLLIYQAAQLAFKQGIVIFLNFLGLVSVMLGLVNLLPIPGLDGGHLLYFAIEKIRGRAISIRLETLLVRLGLIALVVLMVHVTVSDLMRIA